MERLDLEWCGKVVGYLVDPRRTGNHVSGRWLPSKSDLTEPFLQHVRRGYSKPWTKPERVDFILDGEPKVADVTDLMDREIGLRIRTKRIIFPK